MRCGETGTPRWQEDQSRNPRNSLESQGRHHEGDVALAEFWQMGEISSEANGMTPFLQKKILTSRGREGLAQSAGEFILELRRTWNHTSLYILILTFESRFLYFFFFSFESRLLVICIITGSIFVSPSKLQAFWGCRPHLIVYHFNLSAWHTA